MFFNAEECTDKLLSFAPLPAGDYKVCLTECKFEQSDEGYDIVKCSYQVLEGEQKDRTFSDSCWLTSSMATAQTNGRAKLKLLCDLAGIKALRGPSDLANFVGMVLLVTLDAYNKKDGSGIRNSVSNIQHGEAKSVAKKIQVQNGKKIEGL